MWVQSCPSWQKSDWEVLTSGSSATQPKNSVRIENSSPLMSTPVHQALVAFNIVREIGIRTRNTSILSQGRRPVLVPRVMAQICSWVTDGIRTHPTTFTESLANRYNTATIKGTDGVEPVSSRGCAPGM